MDRFIIERGRCEIILGLFIFLTVSNAQLSMYFPRKLQPVAGHILSIFLSIISVPKKKYVPR